MKNIFLGSVFILVFLPQVSFGANQPSIGVNKPPIGINQPSLGVNPPPIINPQQAACNQQLGGQTTAFFAQQAQERGNFGKLHADSLANHDQHFRATLALDMARRTGKSTAGLSTPPDEDPTFAAFVAKQQSDKQAFFAKFNQEMQACLNGQPGTNTP